MNIFEQASATKLRFSSDRGDLTTEQLWDLPLQSKTSFDLDSLAKAINRELKAADEESFISTSTNPAKVKLELQLELLKHIIGVRMQEAEAKRTRIQRESERAKLKEILADKADEALKNMTPEQLTARLKELE